MEQILKYKDADCIFSSRSNVDKMKFELKIASAMMGITAHFVHRQQFGKSDCKDWNQRTT